jgi:hypothetical protein
MLVTSEEETCGRQVVALRVTADRTIVTPGRRFPFRTLPDPQTYDFQVAVLSPADVARAKASWEHHQVLQQAVHQSECQEAQGCAAAGLHCGDPRADSFELLPPLSCHLAGMSRCGRRALFEPQCVLYLQCVRVSFGVSSHALRVGGAWGSDCAPCDLRLGCSVQSSSCTLRLSDLKTCFSPSGP